MKKLLLFGGLLLASLSHCFALIEIGIYAPGTYGANPDGATFEIAISPQDQYPATPAAAQFTLIIFAPTASLTNLETFTVLENNINGGAMQWDQTQTYAHTDGNTYFVFTYSGTGIDLSAYGEDAFVLAFSIGVSGTNDGINWAIADENSGIFNDFIIRSAINLLGANQLVSVAMPAVLPLKLLSFTAKLASLDRIELAWETAEETDMSHFEVERSYQEGVFSTIAKKNAQNISHAFYQLSDQSFRPSLNIYYRLKMIDVDGSFEYSPKRVVMFDGLSEILIYPNPARSYITIQSTLGEFVELINSNGQLLRQIQLEEGEVNLSTVDLPAGNYLINIVDKSKRIIERQQIVLQ